MSLGKATEIEKDGGAHENGHDTFSGECLPLSDNYVTSETRVDNQNQVIIKLEPQDGGHKASVTENDESIGENLPFLPELGTDCLDSYDSAVVENNTEWLKARCKGFGQIEFDIATHPTGDDTLDFPGISLDNKTIGQDSLTTSTNTVAVKSEGMAIITKTVTQGAQYATPYLTLSGSNIEDNDTGWQTSAAILPVTNTSDISKVELAAEGSELSLNLGDIDMNFLKTNLGIKDGVLTLFPSDPNSEVLNETQNETDPPIENAGGSGVTVINSQQNSVPPVGTVLLSAESVPTSQNLSGNLSLATISIATDKSSNCTKIMVDTSVGRQLYHLNTSDLKKLENGVTVNSGDVKTESQPTASSVPSFILLSNPNKDDATAPAGTKMIVERTESPQASKPVTMFMCNVEGCGKMFKNLSKLTVHSMTHTGQRPYKCTEPDCDWAFTKLYKLKRHLESHKGTKEFQCHQCEKRFTTIYNLKAHLKQHKRPCSEECPIPECGLKFQTRRELDKHLKTHEGVEKTYKCPHEGCNKLFLSPYCIGSHPRVHQQDPDELTCKFEGCGRKFDKICRLKQHQRSHTGEKPYVCEFEGCNWAFTTASKLTRHMAKHTNNRKWVCNECGKAFMRSEHLKGHLITHTGIKPFICPVEGCGQKFVSKSSVYVHLKKHDKADKRGDSSDWSEKEITYHCPMEKCDKKYNTKSKLRAHILKHFPDTLKPEDAAQIDIIPLLHEGIGAKETVVEPSTVSVKTGHDGSIKKVDPVEYMATTVDSQTGETTTTVHNQFTAELTAELSNLAAAAEARAPVRSKSSKKENRESEKMSSARTDYESNHMLCERAKKRRKLLREKAAGAAADDTSSPANVMSPSDSNSQTMSESEKLRSHGITFRDPETGVLYVQMQLLQDDPPHPGLLDEHVLNSQLDLPAVITDSNSQSHEFVGSTINLQDLVG